MTLKTKYDIKDIVYIRCDERQTPHMVLGVLVRNNKDNISYEITDGEGSRMALEIELSREPNVIGVNIQNWN